MVYRSLLKTCTKNLHKGIFDFFAGVSRYVPFSCPYVPSLKNCFLYCFTSFTPMFQSLIINNLQNQTTASLQKAVVWFIAIKVSCFSCFTFYSFRFYDLPVLDSLPFFSFTFCSFSVYQFYILQFYSSSLLFHEAESTR